jgi:butyryl-CoA dehydrogenase
MPGLLTGKEDIDFYSGKIYACRYFFSYELPRTMGLAIRLMNSDGLTLEMKNEYF